MKPAQWLAIAGGTWLLFAPAVAGYGGRSADLHRTIGPLLVSFGIVALWDATRDVRWANAPIAAVLAIAPIVVHHSAAAALTAVVTAAVVVASSPFAGKDRLRRGRGWRGVFTTAERS